VIGRRISRLRRDLEDVRAHRTRHRERRRRSGIATVAIVGYTNAGKSTLLNTVSGADAYVADQLFATLDPTTRRVELPGGGAVLFTDTVGFIQRLPTQLVAAFRATLEEVSEADVLLHVVDATHPRALDQAEAVDRTLREIGAATAPGIVALNKADRGLLQSARVALRSRYPQAVEISALTGHGLDKLLQAVELVLASRMVHVDITIPYSAGDLVAVMHEAGRVETEEHTDIGTRITGWLPGATAARIESAVAPAGADAV
jgi:GTP-binding protein HflX